jgi:hypothetical protein
MQASVSWPHDEQRFNQLAAELQLPVNQEVSAGIRQSLRQFWEHRPERYRVDPGRLRGVLYGGHRLEGQKPVVALDDLTRPSVENDEPDRS